MSSDSSTDTINVPLGTANQQAGDTIYKSSSVNNEPDSNITATSTPDHSTQGGYWSQSLNDTVTDYTTQLTMSRNVTDTLALEKSRLIAQKSAVEAWKDVQENLTPLNNKSTASLTDMDIISSHLDSDMNIEIKRANLDRLKFQHKGMNIQSEAAIAHIMTNIVQKNKTGFPSPLKPF